MIDRSIDRSIIHSFVIGQFTRLFSRFLVFLSSLASFSLIYLFSYVLRAPQVGSFYKTPSEPVWVVGSAPPLPSSSRWIAAPLPSRAAPFSCRCIRAFKQQDTEESGYIPKDKLGDVLKRSRRR